MVSLGRPPSITNRNQRNLNNIIQVNINKTVTTPVLTHFFNIKIGHLNIRSLKKRDHLLQLHSLMRDNVHNIFVESESWLNSTISNAEVEIQGYKLSRLDRKKKPGGGVRVYTRTSLKVKI